MINQPRESSGMMKIPISYTKNFETGSAKAIYIEVPPSEVTDYFHGIYVKSESLKE